MAKQSLATRIWLKNLKEHVYNSVFNVQFVKTSTI